MQNTVVHISILCNTTIIVQVCGDWFKTGSEQWDDWNTFNGDGCSSSWTIETGWTWNGVSNINLNKCTEIWGDGKRFSFIFTLIILLFLFK